MRHKLSIVIVSFNARGYLEKCLDSIHRHAPSFAFEVIVVDNASRDGSPELVRERFPQVRLMALERNVGFGPGCNLGLRVGDSEHVLLLNSDTEMLERTLEDLVSALDARPRTGVIAPCFVDGRGEVIQMSWGWNPLFAGEILQKFFSPAPLARSPWRRSLVRRLQRRERTADIVCGAAMLFRREALEQVGGMDEDYVLYLEDSDVCAKLWKAGWEVRFWPGARIVHHLGKSSASEPGTVALLFRQSQLLFYRKHGTALDRLLIQLYLRLRFWRIVAPPREPGPREFYRRLRGVLDGTEHVTF